MVTTRPATRDDAKAWAEVVLATGSADATDRRLGHRMPGRPRLAGRDLP